MKRLIFILCLCSTVSIAYGQVKVSLSYQYGSYNVNNTNTEVLNNDYSGTAQANVIWQFSPYLSAFTGLGYNTNTTNPSTTNYNLNDPSKAGVIFCGNGFYGRDYQERSFSNIEIPVGFRLNTPSFANFEMGLSAGMTAIMTTSESESYSTNYLIDCFGTGNQGEAITTTRTTSSSNRVDVALDIQYNLGLAWQISIAGTWSPYNLGTASIDNQVDYEVVNYETTSNWSKNGQKGARVSVIRSF